MTAAAVLPIINIAGIFESGADLSVYDEDIIYNTEYEPYLDYSKREIEKRLSDLLCEIFGEGSCKAEITLDASDIEDVIIEKVEVTVDKNVKVNEEKLRELIRANTACSNINIVLKDAQSSEYGNEEERENNGKEN